MDGNGLYGSLVHYSMTIVLVGGALILFLYFWYNGRLDMDESPKYQMLQDDKEPASRRSKDD